ncbi:MAG: isoprenylcysteine carboxylmethyltransferase family protein [Acidobacteria bacterium]|nr:isoprenylcysteine carboxylmethyltransferase family protein [Acidobacteriota bacterium]
MRQCTNMPEMRAARPPGALARALTFAGALLFAASLAYFLWFYLSGLERRAASTNAGAAAARDVALFAAFGVHHSLFARARMRAAVARGVSPHLERAVYVWIASGAFLLLCVWWVPFGSPLWSADGGARAALRTLQAAGILFTLWSAGALDALALAGIRQLDAPLPASGIEPASSSLQHTGPYGIVRHPIYLGWLLIVWPAPAMTPSHLLFAAISTAYLLLATEYEERSLRQTFGAAYDDYSRTVRRKMIPGIY